MQGCSSKPEESNLLLPVHFLSMPPGLVKIFPFTKNIEIHVKGPARLIQKISSDNLNYNVDLYTDLASDPAGDSGSIEPGLYSIPVIENRISLHPGIEITSISPSFIIIKLDKMVKKHFHVFVPYSGKPAPGYIALPSESKPGEVELQGAASVIDSIKSVRTKPVDITGFKESFKREIPVDINKTSGIVSKPEIILVSVPIKEKTIIMSFKHIPVKIKNNSMRKIIITPPEMEIQVKGYANILKKKDLRKTFRIYIDLKGLGPGVYVRRAIINLPVGMILTNTKPEIFTVTIEK
jgi:YbbR domain-containing protein